MQPEHRVFTLVFPSVCSPFCCFFSSSLLGSHQFSSRAASTSAGSGLLSLSLLVLQRQVDVHLVRCAVLSISFEVDVPTGKVGGSLLFKCQRREFPRGFWGHAPQKILKFRCLEMLFSTFSRQYLGLKNYQNYAI